MSTSETLPLRSALRPALDHLLKLACERNLVEISVRQGDLSFSLQRRPMAPAPLPVDSAEPAREPAEPAPVADQHLTPVCSTLVGIFHTTGSKGETAASLGSLVKTGDVLAWIESMHLNNEVRAPHAGRLVAVLVEDGLPVEYGQPLLVLEPAG